MRVLTYDDPRAAQAAVADEITTLVTERGVAGRACVLGLATGGTMVGLYAALVAALRASGTRLDHLVTFNLDEYAGLSPRHPRSFQAYMREHLFEPLGLSLDQTHVPDGVVLRHDPAGYARAWERRIREAGGIDLQLLGLGRNGHIAFNEPGADPDSRTRLVELAEATRSDAAATFGGLERVPRTGLTMGVGTIREARRVRLLAFGENKAEAVRATAEGPIDPARPASLLRGHGDFELHLDPAAAALLGKDA